MTVRSVARGVLRLAGAGVVCVVVLAVPAGERVSAHAALESSEPAAGSVLEVSPTEIVLRFTEPVDLVPDSIRVLDADGQPALVSGVGQPGADTLSATVESLGEGTWVVAWRAISADSHPIQGAFAFSVGTASDGEPPPIEVILGDDGGRSAAGWLGAGRAVSYAGITTLVGVFVVVWWVAPALLASRRVEAVLWAAAVLAVAGTIVMIAAQAWQIGGDAFGSRSWRAVISSRSGQWWMTRLVTLAVVPLVVMGRRWLVRSQVAMWVITAVWIVLLGIVAAGGHAVTGRAGLVGFAATLVHLGAVSVWVGGLVMILLAGSGDRWATAARVSPLALAAVAAVAVTGVVNAVRQGALGGLTDTAYGRWLLVKVVIVAAVVAVAAVSRRIVHAHHSTGDGADRERDGGTVPAGLRRTVAFELVGIAVVFAATGGLVMSSPPAAGRQEATVEVVSVIERGVNAQIVVDPAVTGGTTMHVTLTSADPAWSQPDEITVTARQASADVGPIEIPTISAGAQHVIATNAVLPIAGTWTIVVTARYGDFDQITFSGEVEVR